MKRLIKMPSIDQFRNTIYTVSHVAQYQGKDEDNEPIYDRNIKLPVINAIGTEKIHGTNASVCYSEPDGFWVQSKKKILSATKDNVGCSFNAEQNKAQWLWIIKSLAQHHEIDLNKYIITVYYEWCGSGIQTRTAVDHIDVKMAMLFRYFKASPIEPQEDEPANWFETKVGFGWIQDTDSNIYNISNFPIYEFEIDFNEPLMIQNKMIDCVLELEKSSPVGCALGKEGNIGEGIVVSFIFNNNLHMFKVKGDKHSKSKVKTLKPVDTVKLQKLQDIAQKVTPAWRLEQMYDEANDIINGGVPSLKNISLYLKLVKDDIIKEDSDLIAAEGLEPKEVFKPVCTIAALHFKELFNKF